MIEQLTEYLYPTSASYETSSSRTTYDSHQSVVYRTSAASDESASSDTSAALRVGAFNVRIFGQKKVANVHILNILVQVMVNSFLPLQQMFNDDLSILSSLVLWQLPSNDYLRSEP